MAQLVTSIGDRLFHLFDELSQTLLLRRIELLNSAPRGRYKLRRSPREAVYQQTQRWLRAEVFETVAHDLRELMRLAQERDKEPSAAVMDRRTLQSTPESGHQAGFDGHKRKLGSKVHAAVDTPGLSLALVVTPANEQERAQAEQLASEVQAVLQK